MHRKTRPYLHPIDTNAKIESRRSFIRYMVFISALFLVGIPLTIVLTLHPELDVELFSGLYVAYAIVALAVFVVSGPKKVDLSQIGVLATGTIVAFDSTGARVNDKHEMKMRIRVDPSGEPPFVVEHYEMIAIHLFSQFQVGAQLKVRYDPTDRAEFEIIRSDPWGA